MKTVSVMTVMKGWTGRSRILFGLVLLLLVLLAATASIQASTPSQDGSYGQRLILNAYLDSSGKALVTGYANDISGLTFLNASEYRFENETSQLYALTDGLTAKEGELWTLRFGAPGYYDDYRVTFYLPGGMKLGRINISEGLGYLLSASNESMVADVQGYEVHDPWIAIDYRQPLAASSASLPVSARPGPDSRLIFAGVLIVAGLAFAIFAMRRRGRSSFETPPLVHPETAPTPPAKPSLPSDASDASSPSPPQPARPEAARAETADVEEEDEIISARPSLEELQEESLGNSLQENGGLEAAEEERLDEHLEDGLSRKEIEISSEMEAVMQTLTARERAVMTTLIDHRGRMTQAEIRYETRTPKSSLTGILISLERRKLVTKKEWGRTNIIELSEWFLSRKEHS